MWKPRTALGLVDPELGQPPMRLSGDPRRVSILVVEDEHSDRARLAIAKRSEHRLGDTTDGASQGSSDRLDLAGRPRPEKRNRDVQVLDRDDAHALPVELAALPCGDLSRRVVGQAEAEKEA